MIFKKTTRASLFLFLLLTAGVFLYLTREESALPAEKKAPPSEQIRQKVNKEIHFSSESDLRPTIHLTAPLSFLTSDTTFQEKLPLFNCWMSLENESRFFLGKEALIDYPTETLYANELNVTCYKQEKTPYLKGKGKKAKLTKDLLLFEERSNLQYKTYSLKADRMTLTKKGAQAEGSVEISDQVRAITLFCDRAYSDDNQKIHALPKSGERCRFLQGNDLCLAEAVFADPNEKLFLLENPEGTVNGTTFKSDRMLYDENKEQLTMTGMVHIAHATFGDLYTEGEVIRGKNGSILSKGKTELITPMGERLFSPSGILLNKEELLAKGKDLTYTKEGLEVSADRGTLFFVENQKRFLPKELELNDNIVLTSLNPDGTKKCALAHTLKTDFNSKITTLFAKEKERVLFWDEGKKLHIASPQVTMQKERKGEEKIDGQGAVRLSFTVKEKKLFKEIFPDYGP